MIVKHPKINSRTAVSTNYSIIYEESLHKHNDSSDAYIDTKKKNTNTATGSDEEGDDRASEARSSMQGGGGFTNKAYYGHII